MKSFLALPFILAIFCSTSIISQSHALKYDGFFDYVQVYNAPELYPDHITLAAWINPAIIGTADYIISTKHGGGYSLGLNISGGPSINEIGGRCMVDGSYYNIFGTSEIPIDTWTHVALTYDGTQFKIYVNGVEENQTSVSGTLSSANSRLFLGIESKGTVPSWNQSFEGYLDEIAIFNSPLDSSEIQTLMDKQLYPSDPLWNNLEGFWKLDEGTGTLAYDKSGHNNTGTLIYNASWNCDITSFNSIDPSVAIIQNDDNENNQIKQSEKLVNDFSKDERNSKQATFNIFPNPASEVIRIEAIGTLNYSVSIFDIQGQFIKQFINPSSLNIGFMTQGTYIFKIRNLESGITVIKRVIKSG